ncbi:MAG TPA: GAF domain-containing sensor histidine kinase [Trichocoleus sp.]
MLSPERQFICPSDQTPDLEQEQYRLQALIELGLLDAESVTVFEEATQTAAHFLNMPICTLGLLERDRLWFKSAVGLSRIGLMNSLAASRQLPRTEAFCRLVVEHQRRLVIANASADPMYINTLLVQQYGIQSYLGVPLFDSQGRCLGALAVMGLTPREFTDRDIQFVELMARWSMSEFERDRLAKRSSVIQAHSSLSAPIVEANSLHVAPGQLTSDGNMTNSVKATLIAKMTQELCTPLTSILGMARVLSQGIYGTMTEKQKEYIEIIHNSGQYLLSLVNEIVELGALNAAHRSLELNPVDVEMLCQQVITSLQQVAQRREQQIQLSVEPGPRIWLLDKEKVRQLLYHLVFSVIQTSSSDSIVRIHVSRRQSNLTLTIWASHPWLGDGISTLDYMPVLSPASAQTSEQTNTDLLWNLDEAEMPSSIYPATSSPMGQQQDSRQGLGLLLSHQLTELHEGTISVQGSIEEGYRYVIRLPHFEGLEEKA